MKKKLTALIIITAMLFNGSLSFTAFAEGAENAYGHKITYSPITQLYSNGEPLRLFDAGVTEWGKLSDRITRDGAESVKWLQSNSYLLNHFGRKLSGDLSRCLNSKGEWQTWITGPRNVRGWSASLHFDALADKESRANGNISGIYDKGDIQYFFSFKVKTVQTGWGIGKKSNDTGETYALGELVNSSGGGWKKYNTVGDGPNLGYQSAWKSAKNLRAISFWAKSDRDARVDSYLSGAMLVGRDIKGPKIASVRVTADAEGKIELDNGTVTLDNIDKLTDRTVYFQVQWDEPVVFKGVSENEIKKLSLNVDTIGIDGTSGIIAEAPFLKFAPSKTDGKPVMVFEYKIADPYTDSSSVTQERGYFYNFSKVTVSERENNVLWNNIYDVSGNKFAADENGQQPAGKMSAAVSGTSRVDLTPYGIKGIKITKNLDENNTFVQSGELVGITLELNKALSKSIKTEDYPVITLNVKDFDGQNVTIRPSRDYLVRKVRYRPNEELRFGGYYPSSSGGYLKPAEADYDRNSISYYTQLHSGYKMEGDFIKVTSVISDKQRFKDASGYSLMDYSVDDSGMLSPKDIPAAAENRIPQYKVMPNKQYKLDFDAPVFDISADDVGGGVIMITALIDDSSLEGCEASITAKINGNLGDGSLDYQAAASEVYQNGSWKSCENGAANVSFGAPIINKNGKGTAYGFVRFPDNSEADRIEISVTAADEAGNSATSEKVFAAPDWQGFDTLAPVVNASVKQETIDVVIYDLDDEVEYMYGFSDNDADEPSYITAEGKSGTIFAPDIPNDGEIHRKTAWIKAKDSSENVSEVLKLSMKFDRIYATVDYTADTDKTYLAGDYPSASVVIENVKRYWYTWAEKPANTTDTSAYISDGFLSDMKARAELQGNVTELQDEDPDTEQSNNSDSFTAELTADTYVAAINPADESYGDNVLPDDTSRPLILIIAAEKDDGTTLLKTAEFNTLYGAPVCNTIDMSNTAKLAVRVGENPQRLSEPIAFDAGYTVVSAPYCIGDYLSGLSEEYREMTLYYRFEHPESGEVSPIYVLKLRRDNTDPVFDISISETKRMTNEVLVKVKSLTDTQTKPDGTVVTDTPEAFLNKYMLQYYGRSGLSAWRIATENDDIENNPDVRYEWYDYSSEESGMQAYIKVNPDQDGIYHFTSNGYFEAEACDYAGNRNVFLLINGEKIYKEEGADFFRYEINNVSSTPPHFTAEPEIIANETEGSFEINALTESTVKNVYLKFDDSYSGFISDNNLSDDIKYDIASVPGAVLGVYDSESNEITAKIYAKYSDSIPISDVTLVIENEAGSRTEYKHTFETPLYGKKAEIINPKNESGYSVYNYGEALEFSTPVKLDGFENDYSASHSNIPIYADGITQIGYNDLFGGSFTENIYANICGAAFKHSLIFTANDMEITPQTPVSADVKIKIDTSKTENLTVAGGTNEFIFSENGTLSYTLTNTELGQSQKFDFPINNIDKTPPEAIVSINMESETDIETNNQYIYFAVYSIEGFSEDGVTMIADDDKKTISSVNFDCESESTAYTFRFRDAAGNEGSYTADVSDIAFAQRKDNKITGYRLTYSIADENGFAALGYFDADSKPDNLGTVNKPVSVKVQALNQKGEAVSAVISSDGTLPAGAEVYEKEKLVIFESESNTDRTVSLNITGTGESNSVKASVMLPADTIDLTAPRGTVYYASDGTNVKAYLITNDTDIAEDGIYVTGTKADGTPFELKSDENGYYTEFDVNGTGQFIMLDKAGNIGSVAIAVLSIDKEPPKVLSEGWQSIMDARTQEEIEKLLATPTNNTIKLFINFNEQLKAAEVKAYKGSEDSLTELLPTEDYVTAEASGSSLTVEFKQNCRAKLTVYDLRNNALTIWRPKDGEISVIDRDIPKPAEGYPKQVYDNNTVRLEYVFADNEEVMLLQNHEDGYKNSHTVIVSENGVRSLSFADKAGNVYTDYPVVSGIDELAPNIKISIDYIGNVLSANDTYKAGNMYTSGNVRILLNVDDETADGVTVSAKTKSSTEIKVNKENIVLPNGKTYNYNVVVTENGAYQIIARDKWGHENTVETIVSVIDKTAPSIKFITGNTVIKTGTAETEAQNRILADIIASDLQSGANAPLGTKLGEVNDGVTLRLDLSGVNLNKKGTYTAKITAADRLGNTAERSRTVIVKDNIYLFEINGFQVYADDVVTAQIGRIRLQNISETAKYYYAQGYKTAAQMKYAKSFNANEGFDALQKGYYTILSQESDRSMHLLYVYVN